MAKSGVIDRDLGLKEIKAELKKLKSMSVKVGIVEGHNKTEDGVNIAEYNSVCKIFQYVFLLLLMQN